MKCTNIRSNKDYAVKILNSKQSTRLEVDALRLCRKNSKFVQYVETISDDAYTYIVTEWLRGQELFNRALEKRFTENEVKILFSQIVDAVEHMHDKGIIHRDLKLENIMVVGTKNNPLNIKIVDFGFACRKNSAEASILCYTLDYVAPEVLCNEKITEACDLWSLGVILYTLLCGKKPFRSDPKPRKEGENQIRDRIRTGSFDRNSAEWHRLSKPAKDLITRLLTVNVDERLNIREAAQHAWLIESPVGSPDDTPVQSPTQSPIALRDEIFTRLEKHLDPKQDANSLINTEAKNAVVIVDDEVECIDQEANIKVQTDNSKVQISTGVEDISDVEDIGFVNGEEPMEIENNPEIQPEIPIQINEFSNNNEQITNFESYRTTSVNSVECIEPNTVDDDSELLSPEQAIINNNDKFIDNEPENLAPVYSPVSSCEDTDKEEQDFRGYELTTTLPGILKIIELDVAIQPAKYAAPCTTVFRRRSGFSSTDSMDNDYADVMPRKFEVNTSSDEPLSNAGETVHIEENESIQNASSTENFRGRRKRKMSEIPGETPVKKQHLDTSARHITKSKCIKRQSSPRPKIVDPNQTV